MNRVRIDLVQIYDGRWSASAFVDRAMIWQVLCDSALGAQCEAREAVAHLFPELAQ